MTVFPFRNRKARVERLKTTCAQIAKTHHGDTRAIYAHLNQMILEYYSDVLSQAKQSFWSAVTTGAVGAAFFFWAVYNSMDHGASTATLAVIGGAIVQTISGIQFFIYTRASRQFASFHICLERMNRLLLADTICENIKNEAAKEHARLQLVQLIATAPMLVLDEAGAANTSTPAGPQIPSPPSGVSLASAA